MADAPPSTGRSWSGRSHGGRSGTVLIASLIRLAGRELTAAVLVGPALWFWLMDHRARRAVVEFRTALRPELPAWRHALAVPWHFWVFARGLADRLLLTIRPRSITILGHGQEHLSPLLARPGGAILLSAHIGSFEIAAHFLAGAGTDKVLNVVLYDGEDPQVRAVLDQTMGRRPWRIIDLRDPTGASLAIVAALGRGELVGMLGDRVLGGDAGHVMVPFLGRPAAFPTGPFIAAHATGVPILPVFCCRSGWARWTCTLEAPMTVDLGSRGGREARLAATVGRWAARVADHARRHPDQWNNYFPFWGAPNR